MISLGDILNSKARVEMLQVFIQLENPVGIRKLSRICGLHPRSVELALKGLVGETWIRKEALSRGSSYAFNWKHPDAERLRCVFDVDAQTRLQNREPQFLRDGKSLCLFIEDGLALLERGRASINVVK